MNRTNRKPAERGPMVKVWTRRGGSSGRRSRAEAQIMYTRAVGMLLIAGGFVAILVGWAGAARVTCVDCQIPYLLSGGAAGLGLVMLGLVLLLSAQMRTENRRIAQRIETLVHTLMLAVEPEAVGVDEAPGAGLSERPGSPTERLQYQPVGAVSAQSDGHQDADSSSGPLPERPREPTGAG